jgi:hypothetical protein
MSRLLLLLARFALVFPLLSGCAGYVVTRDPTVQRVAASDGHVLPYADNNSLLQALRTSGAQDLACPIDQVTARTLIAADTGVVSNLATDTASYHYLAEGCGQRAVYIWATNPSGKGEYTTQATLIGLVPIKA